MIKKGYVIGDYTFLIADKFENEQLENCFLSKLDRFIKTNLVTIVILDNTYRISSYTNVIIESVVDFYNELCDTYIT